MLPNMRAIADDISRLPGRALVAVDGVDGAGKTTFADALAPLIARPVVRASVDGFHHPARERHARGRESGEGFYRDSYDYEALRRDLLDPFRDGAPFRRAVFDWRTDSPVETQPLTAPDDAVLVLDGIFLHRPELRSYWTFSIFLRVSEATSIARCAARDGAEAAANPRYVHGQRLYLAECDPERRATRVVDND